MKRLALARVLLSGSIVLGAACSSEEEVKEPVSEAEDADDKSADEGEDKEESDEGDQAPVDAELPPTDEAASAPAPEAPPPPPASTNFEGPKVDRYVTAYALNVRAEPSKSAKVIRHVKLGDKLSVVMNGEWAQIGPGEFVSANRLSETVPPPKKWMTGTKNKAQKKKKLRKKN